jgi:hypothetical protein
VRKIYTLPHLATVLPEVEGLSRSPKKGACMCLMKRFAVVVDELLRTGPLILPLIKAMKVRIAVRHTSARPPLMPGFIDWLTRFDDK